MTVQRTAFGVTQTKTRTSAPYNGDDWDDMRQDDPDEWQQPTPPVRRVEQAARPATPAPARAEQPRETPREKPQPAAEASTSKRPRGRPSRKQPGEPEKPQDRTPRDGYQHFLIRNISKDTINTLDALAKAEKRSLNFIIIHILDDYTNER